MNNIFPLKDSSIITPTPYDNKQYERDSILNKAVVKQTNKIDYTSPAISFPFPKNSNDLIQSKEYKDFDKSELTNKYIHEIYDMMSDKIIEPKPTDISQILGTNNSELNNKPQVTGLYKPVLSMIDPSNSYNNTKIDYNYQPYDGTNIHHFIKN